MNIIFFAGSFNPFTKGHADILKRLLRLADKVIVGIGANIEKPESFSLADINASAIKDFIRKENLTDRAEVAIYTGLTAEEALKRGAKCLARGVRSATDFDYEFSLASLNREAFGIETILLAADPKLSYVSSTAIRDLEKHGRNDLARKFLP